jgi:N-acetylneuraminic acid mutarotase
VWTADANFTGGWFASTNFAVANTNDDPLYLSRRAGDFSYSRAVPNGDYTLKLLFADYLTTGQRKFNVSAEGKSILSNYDIVADAGTKTAITKWFPVTVTDGKIDVAFTSVVNYATISALELVAVGGGGGGTSDVPAQPTNLTATAGVGKVSLAWKDNASNEQSYEVWRQINGGAITFVATRPANSTAYDDLNLDPTKTYTYFVRALNATGAGSPSFSASAKPLAGSTTIAWSTTGKNMPLTRAEGGGAAANGKFYVFGGFIDGQLHVTTQLDIYDPATNTWTQGAPCPAPTTHASTAVDGNTIWVAGFFYNNGVTASRLVYKYDTVTNTWSAGPQLPAPRGAGALAIVGRELHYWGGLTGATTGAADHWRLNLDNVAAGWVTDTPLPSTINHQAGVALNGKLYSIGGMIDKQENTGNQSTVRVYDPATRQWTLAKSLPVGRAHIGPATFIRNGRIVLAGGNINGTDITRDVLEYNPDTNTWSNLTPLPAARKSSNAAFINGKIVVIGGNNPVPSNSTWIGT